MQGSSNTTSNNQRVASNGADQNTHKVIDKDGTMVKTINIEFIDPDKNYPLIWDIKNMVFKKFGISIDSQLLYNGSGLQVADMTPFIDCKEMKQPFRLKIS